jgi:hypothetical protein
MTILFFVELVNDECGVQILCNSVQKMPFFFNHEHKKKLLLKPEGDISILQRFFFTKSKEIRIT